MASVDNFDPPTHGERKPVLRPRILQPVIVQRPPVPRPKKPGMNIGGRPPKAPVTMVTENAVNDAMTQLSITAEKLLTENVDEMVDDLMGVLNYPPRVRRALGLQNYKKTHKCTNTPCREGTPSGGSRWHLV